MWTKYGTFAASPGPSWGAPLIGRADQGRPGATDAKQGPAGATIRALMRRAKPAALATSLVRDQSAWPCGSLVLGRAAPAGSPALLARFLVRLTKRARRQRAADSNRS